LKAKGLMLDRTFADGPVLRQSVKQLSTKRGRIFSAKAMASALALSLSAEPEPRRFAAATNL
jgi:hypothetical protein